MEVALLFIVCIWTITEINGNGEFQYEPWTPMVENFNVILKRIEGNYGKKDLVDGIMIESLEYAISKDCKDGLIKEIDGPYPTAVPGVFSKLYVLANPRDQVEEQLFWILPSVDCHPQTTVNEKSQDQPSMQESSLTQSPLPSTFPASIPQNQQIKKPRTLSLKQGNTETGDLNIPAPMKLMPKYLVVENPGGETMIAVASPFKPSSPKTTRPAKVNKIESNPLPIKKTTFFRDQQSKHNHEVQDPNLQSSSTYVNHNSNSHRYRYDPQQTNTISIPVDEKLNYQSSALEKSHSTHLPHSEVPATSLPKYQPLSHLNPTSQQDKMIGVVTSNGPPTTNTIPKHIIMDTTAGDNMIDIASPRKPSLPKFTYPEKVNEKGSLELPQEHPTYFRHQQSRDNHDYEDLNSQLDSNYGSSKAKSLGNTDDPRRTIENPSPDDEKLKDLSASFEKSHGPYLPPSAIPATSLPEYQPLSNPNPTSQRDTMSGVVTSNIAPPLKPIPKHIIVDNPIGDNMIEVASPLKPSFTQQEKVNHKGLTELPQGQPTSFRDQQSKGNNDDGDINSQLGSNYGIRNKDPRENTDDIQRTIESPFPVNDILKDLSASFEKSHGPYLPPSAVPANSIPEYQSLSNPNPTSQRHTMSGVMTSNSPPPLQPIQKHIIADSHAGDHVIAVANPLKLSFTQPEKVNHKESTTLPEGQPTSFRDQQSKGNYDYEDINSQLGSNYGSRNKDPRKNTDDIQRNIESPIPVNEKVKDLSASFEKSHGPHLSPSAVLTTSLPENQPLSNPNPTFQRDKMSGVMTTNGPPPLQPIPNHRIADTPDGDHMIAVDSRSFTQPEKLNHKESSALPKEQPTSFRDQQSKGNHDYGDLNSQLGSKYRSRNKDPRENTDEIQRTIESPFQVNEKLKDISPSFEKSHAPYLPPSVVPATSNPEDQYLSNPNPTFQRDTMSEVMTSNGPPPLQPIPKHRIADSHAGDHVIAVANPLKLSFTQPEKVNHKESTTLPEGQPTSFRDQQSKGNHDYEDINSQLGSNYGSGNKDPRENTDDIQRTIESPIPINEKVKDLSASFEKSHGPYLPPSAVPATSLPENHPLSNPNPTFQRDKTSGVMTSNSPSHLQPIPTHRIADTPAADNIIAVDSPLMPSFSQPEKVNHKESTALLQGQPTSFRDQQSKGNHDYEDLNSQLGSNDGSRNNDPRENTDDLQRTIESPFPVNGKVKDLSASFEKSHGPFLPPSAVPPISLPEYQPLSNPNPTFQRETMREVSTSNSPPPLQPIPKHLVLEDSAGDNVVTDDIPFEPKPSKITQLAKLNKEKSILLPHEQPNFFTNEQGKPHHDYTDPNLQVGSNYGNRNANSQENSYDSKPNNGNPFTSQEKPKDHISALENPHGAQIPPEKALATPVTEQQPLPTSIPTLRFDSKTAAVNSYGPQLPQEIPNHVIIENPAGDKMFGHMDSSFKLDSPKNQYLDKSFEKVSNLVHRENPAYTRKPSLDDTEKGLNPQYGHDYGNDDLHKQKNSYNLEDTISDLRQSPSFEKINAPPVPNGLYHSLTTTESRPYDLETDIGKLKPKTSGSTHIEHQIPKSGNDDLLPYHTPVENSGKHEFGKFLPARSNSKHLSDSDSLPIIPGGSPDGQGVEQDHKESKVLPTDKGGSFKKEPFEAEPTVSTKVLSKKHSLIKDGTPDLILKSPPSIVEYPHSPPDLENGKQPHHLRTQDKPNVLPTEYGLNLDDSSEFYDSESSHDETSIGKKNTGRSRPDQQSDRDENNKPTIQQAEKPNVNQDQNKNTLNPKPVQLPIKPRPLRPVLATDEQFSSFIEKQHKKFAQERYDDDR